MSSDKRRRTRVDAGFQARVSAGGRSAVVRTVNLSLKGVLVQPEPDLRPGEDCLVRLELAEDAAIEVEGVLVRVDERGAAIDFKEMDEASFTHLRRLVQLHAADADAIDREMSVPAFKASS